MTFEAWVAEFQRIVWEDRGVRLVEPNALRTYFNGGYTPRAALEEDTRPEHYPISK